jgi:hypothetical protein
VLVMGPGCYVERAGSSAAARMQALRNRLPCAHGRVSQVLDVSVHWQLGSRRAVGRGGAAARARARACGRGRRRAGAGARRGLALGRRLLQHEVDALEDGVEAGACCRVSRPAAGHQQRVGLRDAIGQRWPLVVEDDALKDLPIVSARKRGRAGEQLPHLRGVGCAQGRVGGGRAGMIVGVGRRAPRFEGPRRGGPRHGRRQRRSTAPTPQGARGAHVANGRAARAGIA